MARRGVITGSGNDANKYCRSRDLDNEASVEAFFVLRMLADLGFADDEIKPKNSIDALSVARGRGRERYKPDFLIVAAGQPRWLVEAKGTEENIEDFTYQGAGYAFAVNRRSSTNPLRFYMLTNGLLTRVYAWDQQDPVLSLRFADLEDGNPRYETLRQLLGADVTRSGWREAGPTRTGASKTLTRPSIDEVKRSFSRCHRAIWKGEKMSPQAAFLEFAKLLFVKLWEDRRLRDDPAMLALIGSGQPVPADRLRFSLAWITDQERNDLNPVADILFRQLANALETEIAQRRRKRIFDADEQLDLGPGTVRRVVKELEGFYLFGIDEDLNGRMFEAFLTATMRGQDLGQYFTPRSIAKLTTSLAQPIASPAKVERVLDACCGTGGFLIEALTEMRAQIYGNGALTGSERKRLLDEVANEAIFGVDAGRDPPIARIARINMYLHGDGGSRIYVADGLSRPPATTTQDREIRLEVDELGSLLASGPIFDVALTNPPFSMDYSMDDEDERRVLERYDLLTFGGKRRRTLRSSVMFIEQYWHLLVPGGRLLTVVDDSLLGAANYGYFRDFLRERFVIRAVISLHGDAFRRAGARVKTSVLYLTKRASSSETQPAAFVYESRYIGLDDVPRTTRASVATAARVAADQEREEIVAAYRRYQAGGTGPWLVAAEKLGDRLDAKFLLPWSVASLVESWTVVGASAVALGDLVDPVTTREGLDDSTEYTFLKVSYDGVAEWGDQALGSEVSYAGVGRARAGDIVVSNINAVNGASCVLPSGLENLLVSIEFTILRIKPGVEVDPYYLWSVLRTPGVIAEWLSTASGVGRHRIDWGTLSKQLVPMLPLEQQRSVGALHREAAARLAEARRLTEQAEALIGPLGLDSDAARDRLVRAKPPR